MLSPRLRWKLNQALERAREALKGSKPEPRPRICFNCGRLVGAVEKTCSNCGVSQSKASLGALRRVSLAVIPDENPVTYTLLLANLLFMIITILASQNAGAEPFSVDNRVLLMLGAKYTELIVRWGQIWRLVMPILLHGSLMHFGFNSFVLWQIGPQVEELFGSHRFLFLYLTTGVFGFIASALWSPSVLSIGASGSIFGLIGILLSYISQRPGFAEEYRASLIRWAVFMLVLGLLMPGIDNAAHIGGLLSGMALGRLVDDRRPQTPSARLRVNLMGWGSAAIFLLSILLVILNLPTGTSR